ncbi:MAG: DUF2461 domain-containing protein [Deltaproteobacteria bacterium]|nr:MAG: DUF2461 domain-containing protein [Deltaproteobacteria bacterium]
MAFTGFEKGQVRFFRLLAKKQDRAWFKVHKGEYEAIAERPMKALVDDLHARLTRQYRKFALRPPKLFRIYRDTRFSRDKSPFKTGSSAVIGFQGKEEEGPPAALYVHLGVQDYAGAGHWHLPPGRVARYRKLVADEKTGRELQKRLDALTKKGFKIESWEALKRVPPGFPPDHPRADLLKRKGVGISFPKIPKEVRFSPKLRDWLAARSAETAPLIGWIEEHLS